VLTTLLDLRQVVSQVTRVLTKAMHLEGATVCVLDSSGAKATLWSRESGGELQTKQAGTVAQVLARTLERLGSWHGGSSVTALIEQVPEGVERAEAAAWLRESGASGVVALKVGGRTTGMLLLGPKRSGQPFDSNEMELLQTLANQTAIALQNARSYQELEELTQSLDEQVHRQTEALRHSNTQLTQAYEDLKNTQAQLVQSEKMASLGQLVADHGEQ
jgi:GAF domain-containing protein